MNRQTDILDQLPHLPPEQLQQLKDRVTVLLSVGGKGPRKGKVATTAPTGADAFAVGLYDALAAELKRRTQVRSLPFPVFAGSSQYATHFQPAAKAAYEANAQWFPKQSRVELQSMLGLYAKLALDYLARQDRPAVWYNIAAALNALPQVVDQAFPGYAAAGMLGKVQSMRTRGHAA